MAKVEWTCSPCGAVNHVTVKFCEACGEARDTPAPPSPAAYTPPWERPGWIASRPEDRCTEEGCTLTVREHIEEFHRHHAPILVRAARRNDAL